MFRYSLSFIALVFYFLVGSSFAQPSRQRPNVLIIMGDDHAPYVYGAYGNPKAKTPNLDKFAASGMRFDRAYCNSPVCTASRQSLITGRLPHSAGVTLLSTVLSDEVITLGDLFLFNDYATGAFGKMHFNSSDKKHGFRDLYESEQAERAISKRGARAVDPFISAQPPWRPFVDPARIWLNAANEPVRAHTEDMDGMQFAGSALKFLQEVPEQEEKPFFAIVSFKEPHSPFRYPVELKGLYDPATFEVPALGPEDEAQIPHVFKDLTREEKQGIIAAYYTSVAFLDQCVGKVLDGLEAKGLSEKTLVIYVGDHGYCLGQHGRFEKHSSYEQAVRAPLVVRWPGHTTPGAVSEALVEFIDIFPTITEICRVSNPAEVEGRSLVPILEGRATKHRDVVFSEYLDNEEAMIRDERYKLVYTTGKRMRTDHYEVDETLPGRTTKFYDLQTDPDEFHNLAAMPEHRAAIDRMKQEMVDRILASSPEGFRFPPEAIAEDKLEILLIPPEERRKIDFEFKQLQIGR